MNYIVIINTNYSGEMPMEVIELLWADITEWHIQLILSHNIQSMLWNPCMSALHPIKHLKCTLHGACAVQLQQHLFDMTIDLNNLSPWIRTFEIQSYLYLQLLVWSRSCRQIINILKPSNLIPPSINACLITKVSIRC